MQEAKCRQRKRNITLHPDECPQQCKNTLFYYLITLNTRFNFLKIPLLPECVLYAFSTFETLQASL